MNIKKIMLFGFILSTILFAGILIGDNNPKPTGFATATAEVYSPTQELVGLSRKIGIPDKALYDTRAVIGIPQSANCDPHYFAACYVNETKQIFIYETSFTNPNNDAATALAYEYSHYYWNVVLSNGDQTAIIPRLMNFYNSHPTLIEAMKPYIDHEGGVGSPIFIDELHATICTQVHDNELPYDLYAHCSSYLPNRNALRSYY